MRVSETTRLDPMGSEPIEKILPKFAIPAVASNLFNALYNIVDQIYIGQGVGYLGNAATNVAFPVTTICMAVGLLLGVGAASKFNLEMGRGNRDKVNRVTATCFSTLILVGVALFAVIELLAEPLMRCFGATDQILEYAVTYTRITGVGIPFLLISTGGNPLIRSDGRAKWSMFCVVSGAVLNMILDPIFIFVFHWGVAGAAIATIISQILSAILVLCYIPRFQLIHLSLRDFLPSGKALREMCALGMTPAFNQLASLVVQVVLNNLLRTYGALSVYGSEIPLAVGGIVTKVNVIFTAIILGIAQGAQPIHGFNYGAGLFHRVRQTYKLESKVVILISVLAFLLFELLAAPIISLFGSENALYHQFADNYLRVYLFCTFLNGMQQMSTMFFSATGHAKEGALLTLSRQVLFLLPLLCLFAWLGGVDGIKFAAPVADTLAFCITMVLVRREFQHQSALVRQSAAEKSD